jgi:hypothetical protein
MAEDFANDYRTLLAAAIDADDTTLTLLSTVGTGLNPAPDAPFRIRIEDELILVGARTEAACSSLTRGIEGTTAAAHASGVVIRQVLTVTGLMTAIEENSSAQIEFDGEAGNVAVFAASGNQLEDGLMSLPEIITAGGQEALNQLAPLSYLTINDDTPDLPNARRLAAGSGVSFDDTTPGVRTVSASASSNRFAFGWNIGNGTDVITTGTKTALRVPQYGGTIDRVTITAADASLTSGSISLTVKKATFATSGQSFSSIVASDPPAISSAQAAQKTSFASWTLTFSAGDLFQVVVDSVTSMTQVFVLVEGTTS